MKGKITLGDQDHVECPHCGELMDISQLRLDGCLEEGHDGTCEFCEGPWVIVTVEIEATVRIGAL